MHNEHKRGRSDEDGAGSANDLVDRSSLESILGDYKKDIANDLNKSTENLLRRYDNAAQKRLASIESNLHNLNKE